MSDHLMLSFDEPERWLPVARYEGLYEVSSLGRVRSLPRYFPHNKRRKVYGGKVLRATPAQNDYLHVTLSKNNSRESFWVHRLVAATFIGPRPEFDEGRCEIRHLDGNKANCAASNLAYGTTSDNALDRVEHGTHRNTRKTHCPYDHKYTPANTIVYRGRNGRTWRRCRKCRNEARNARRQLQREQGVRVT